MDVTVAICTWNRAHLLSQTLEQFTTIAVPEGLRWELLVVNNNSTDNTNDVASQFASRLPLRCVFEPIPGLCNARNAALRDAAGAWILFTDDDVLVDPNWVRECLHTASRFPDAAVIGGPIEPWFPVPPDPAVLQAFPIARGGFCGVDFGREERILDGDSSPFGANIAFRADVVKGIQFDAAFGPSPTTKATGDEVDFVRRVRSRGGIVVWSPRMAVKHYVDPSRMTVDYLAQYHVDHARTMVRLSGKPVEGAHMWFGAPAWLWKTVVHNYLNYLLAKGRGLPPATTLTQLRNYSHFRGMLMESRELHSRARV